MIKNLYRCFVGFLLALVSFSALATAPVTKITYQFGDTFYPTTSAYCSAAYTSVYSAVRGVFNPSRVGYPDGVCDTFNSSGQLVGVVTISKVTKLVCENGITPNTSRPLDQQCDPDCSSKTPYSAYQEWDTIAAGMKNQKIPTQIAWCKVDINTMSLTKCVPTDAGKFRCYWKVTNTGEAGTAQDLISAAGNLSLNESGKASTVVPQTAPSVDSKCPVGTVSGGTSIDGMPICMGTGTGPKPPSLDPTKTTGITITKDNGDGTSTTANTTSVKNADGSVTTITNTINKGVDGSQTTSQTAVTSSNTAGEPGQYDDPKDKDDLCKRNPLLNICKNSSVTGTCAAIACDGDAIQCATLRAAAAMECRGKADMAALGAMSSTNLGNSLISGVDPMAGQISAAMTGNTVDLSQNNLDTSGFLGAGSCFGAKSMTVLGHEFVANFSAVCNAILPLRLAILAMASVISYLIVARSILR